MMSFSSKSLGMAECANHDPANPHSSAAGRSDGKGWLHAIPSAPRASSDTSAHYLLC